MSNTPTVPVPSSGGKDMPTWQQHKGDQMILLGEIVSLPFASILLSACNLLPTLPEGEVKLFDNAAGSGPITYALLKGLSEEEKGRVTVVCGDVQPGMLDFLRRRIAGERWGERVEVKVIDAQETKLPAASFTHILTGFTLQLLPRPMEAMSEILRLLLPGGISGYTTWNQVGHLSLVERAMTGLDGCPPFPGREKLADLFGTGRWGEPEFLKQKTEEAGFTDVQVEVKEHTAVIDDPEEFVRLFGDMFLGVATRFWTEEERKEWAGKVKEEMGRLVREEVREKGKWELRMSANVVVCRKSTG